MFRSHKDGPANGLRVVNKKDRRGPKASITVKPGERENMKDWCDEEGAKRLREKISAYWAERGYEVDVDLIDAGFVPAMRSARTDVRSNMVNGMPRRRIASETGSARPSYRPREQREVTA